MFDLTKLSYKILSGFENGDVLKLRVSGDTYELSD